jgi:flagellar basal-body rod protein FlgF
MESLEMLANNIANAATPGFKADREFYSTYYAPEAFDGPEGTLPVASPVIETNWTDFKQGVRSSTGNPLDFAIDGSGFFTIERDDGVFYTRNGSFQMDPDGYLVTQAGDAVLDIAGKPIVLDPQHAVQVDQKGNITQQGRTIAQLGLAQFDSAAQLKKLGATYFRYDGSSEPRKGSASVSQGSLEGSNLDPATAAVRLVSVMRQFEMLQRAMTLGAEMNRRAVEEVARVRD